MSTIYDTALAEYELALGCFDMTVSKVRASGREWRMAMDAFDAADAKVRAAEEASNAAVNEFSLIESAYLEAISKLAALTVLMEE